MNKSISKLFVCALLVALSLTTSCKKDDTEVAPTTWVTIYTNAVLGDQNNTTNGHFFQPQTGQSIAIENVGTQQRSIAMLFFTESGGANSFLTFPADGTSASTFGTSTIRLFTQNPGGINHWDQTTLNSGKIYKSTLLDATHFNDLTTGGWTKFDAAFKESNSGNEYLSQYKLNYELNPAVGNVYLVQFNGLVRAIICIKGIVTSGANGGNIRFDMIIEGRDIYKNNSEVNLLQPLVR